MGELRHIDTRTRWAQEQARSKQIDLCKFHEGSDAAVLLTKHLPSWNKLEQLAVLFGCAFRGGRAAAAPLLRKKVDDPEDRPTQTSKA